MSDNNERSKRLLGFDLADGRFYMMVGLNGDNVDDPSGSKIIVGIVPTYLGGDPTQVMLKKGETRYLLSAEGGHIMRLTKNEENDLTLEQAGGIPKRYAAVVPPDLEQDDGAIPSASLVKRQPAPEATATQEKQKLKPIDFELLQQCHEELKKVVGLNDAKEAISKKVALAFGQREKIELYEHLGLPAPEDESFSLHLVLTGNPGTGKTTLARIYGKYMKALGFLEKGDLIECKEDDLIGEYVGKTAIKTNKKVDDALDNVLYIDEAHNMLPESGDGGQFHRQSLGVLTARMENDRHRLVVVMSGYREPLQELVKKTPGFPSRFKTFIHNEDYEPDELKAIFNGMVQKRNVDLAPGTAETAYAAIALRKASAGELFENGREVRNLIEDAIEHMFTRTCDPDVKRKAVSEMTKAEMEVRLRELRTLVPEDFNHQSNGFRLKEKPRRGVGFMATFPPANESSMAAPPAKIAAKLQPTH